MSKPFAAVGGRFRLSTLFPVWNPVGGQLIEVDGLEYGNRAIGSTYDYVRMSLEAGIVRQLPPGSRLPVSKTRLALRGLRWARAFRTTCPYFRLGGGNQAQGARPESEHRELGLVGNGWSGAFRSGRTRISRPSTTWSGDGTSMGHCSTTLANPISTAGSAMSSTG